MTGMIQCPFCKIVALAEEGFIEGVPERFWDRGDVVTFEPLNPVTPGHTLIVPKLHVADYVENPLVTGRVFQVAAEFTAAARRQYHEYNEVLGRRDLNDVAFNVISSAGADATQTVFHLHVHVVPRLPNDGLHLPWTGQHD